MARLFFCTVSTVRMDNATVDVMIEELEGLMKTNVPVLDTVYNMPVPGDTVVALFDEQRGKLQRGVILGRPYHETSIMDTTASVVNVKNLIAESITYHNSCEKG